MTEKMTAAEAIAALRPPTQCATCRAVQAIGADEAAVLLAALPAVGYRGLSRAFGLMGHKVRPDSIQTHLKNGHTA